MGKKKIQKFTRKIWNIELIRYTCIVKKKIMATIREQVIKTLYDKWAEIKCRKNEITNEMWKLEQIEDHIKNKLKSYGKTIETDPMDQNPAIVGEVCRAIDLVISGSTNGIHIVCRESPSSAK